MRHLYRIFPAFNPAQNSGGEFSKETYYVFAENANAAFDLAFTHSDGIPHPDGRTGRTGWTVVKCEGIALEAE